MRDVRSAERFAAFPEVALEINGSLYNSFHVANSRRKFTIAVVMRG